MAVRDPGNFLAFCSHRSGTSGHVYWNYSTISNVCLLFHIFNVYFVRYIIFLKQLHEILLCLRGYHNAGFVTGLAKVWPEVKLIDQRKRLQKSGLLFCAWSNPVNFISIKNKYFQLLSFFQSSFNCWFMNIIPHSFC